MLLTSLTCVLNYNEKTVELPLNKRSFFDELYVEFNVEEKGIYQRIQLTIHPKEDVILKDIRFKLPFNFMVEDTPFCNGFQSWSESREFSFHEKPDKIRGIVKPFMGHYGDYHFEDIPRGKGHLHSWTYGYVRRNKQLEFFGSLNEATAFTIIEYNKNAGEIVIRKDISNMKLTHTFPLADIFIMQGDEQAIFKQYFKLMDIAPPKVKPAIGWTSWYHYYTNIDEAIILKNLEAFAEKEVPIDIFQIDDGFQQYVGDWLKIKQDKFPRGMDSLAKKIHQKGYKAGLWLAPFICEKDSEIFNTKKDWLLKDDKGNPVKAGYNPGWSGWFYALDFYHPQVQEYLSGVIYTALNKWGYDMLKLDFLYAVCILPRPQKTRGQIMHDAMHFLRKQADDKWLLGCGVPLGSSFGLVDYCRIGADIHLKWEHQFLKWVRNRERVSTILALRNTLGRWQLNGRAFLNDPDVFILRDQKNDLTNEQQYTILIVNTLLGTLLFTSDYLADYTAEQWDEYQAMLKWKDSEVKRVERIDHDIYAIHFVHHQQNYIAITNLRTKNVHFNFNKKNMALDAFETIILKAW